MADEAEYANPDVPHEVNVGEKTPLPDFFRLSLGLVLLTLIVTTVVFFVARRYAPSLPFRYEAALADAVWKRAGKKAAESAGTASACAAGERALQRLADRLAAKMKLPQEMTIRVHLVPGRQANAFATLGGHILVNTALVERVHSENALAMVLAHEIGHIKHRDPIVALGGGVAVALLLSATIGGSDGGVLAGWAVGMTQMSFSRAQEERADREALSALRTHYGHTGGADEFFATIMDEHPATSKIPVFLNTHPMPSTRLDAIRATFPPVLPALRPLPESLRSPGGCVAGMRFPGKG
jgi:Zn-dependent protease with chaperone function